MAPEAQNGSPESHQEAILLLPPNTDSFWSWEALRADGKTAYVLSLFPGTVTPIATATNTAGKPINVGRIPRAIAITP